MPEVRRFVKEEGHADSYEGMEIDFVRGHKPVLIIMDDFGKELDKIEFSRDWTLSDLHKLMFENGFTTSSEKVPDEWKQARDWTGKVAPPNPNLGPKPAPKRHGGSNKPVRTTPHDPPAHPAQAVPATGEGEL
mmetsp:Transcript_43687/g.137161  ORF Transcript_43687/g.137161 Transcript_43687/m.137161 type:complete len:133 (-) Transcript_43687:1188-1586(-)